MRASLVVILLVLVVQCSTCADDKPANTQTFRLKHGLAAFYDVGRVDANGRLRLKRRSIPSYGFREAPQLTEGYFVGLAWENSERFSASSHFFRVHVEAVSPQGELDARVDKSVVAHFENVKLVGLFRPFGSTTTAMQAAPAYARVIDGSREIVGMDQQQQQQLAECRRRLKRVGIALHNFHDAYAHFPPAIVYGPDGKPWHSWRVLLLPFLDHAALYDQYRLDEPWDGPNNKKLLKQIPEVYRNPVYAKQDDAFTHFAAVVTESSENYKRAVFSLKGGRFSGVAKDLPAAFKAGCAFRQIIDGTANTVAVGTVSPLRGIPWMKPSDIEFDDKFKGLGPATFDTPFAAKSAKASLFLRVDGSVNTVRADIDRELLRRLFLIGDRKVLGNVPTLDSPGLRTRGSVPVIEIIKRKDGIVAKLRYIMDAPAKRNGDGSAPDGSAASSDDGDKPGDRP